MTSYSSASRKPLPLGPPIVRPRKNLRRVQKLESLVARSRVVDRLPIIVMPSRRECADNGALSQVGCVTIIGGRTSRSGNFHHRKVCTRESVSSKLPRRAKPGLPDTARRCFFQARSSSFIGEPSLLEVATAFVLPLPNTRDLRIGFFINIRRAKQSLQQHTLNN